MYLKQSDLFLGLGNQFLKQVMTVAEKASFEGSEIVFREDHPADNFFILINGQVSILQEGQVVYTTSAIGEVFGCAGIIGRDSYFLTLQCDQPSVLLRFDRRRVQTLLDNDADNAVLFYRQLASALAHRLHQLYRSH